MSTRSEDEVERESRDLMGEELGGLYWLLWRELATLQLTWLEYRKIFASGQENFDIMNATAPRFFRRLDASMWQATLLHLCRVTDRPSTGGTPNLTVMKLPACAKNATLRGDLERLTSEAREATRFARQWRNKHLAHRDLGRAQSPDLHPLPLASRERVENALAKLRDVMNHIEIHFRGSAIQYEDTVVAPGGAGALLHFLKLGHEAHLDRKRRLLEGRVE